MPVWRYFKLGWIASLELVTYSRGCTRIRALEINLSPEKWRILVLNDITTREGTSQKSEEQTHLCMSRRYQTPPTSKKQKWRNTRCMWSKMIWGMCVSSTSLPSLHHSLLLLISIVSQRFEGLEKQGTGKWGWEMVYRDYIYLFRAERQTEWGTFAFIRTKTRSLRSNVPYVSPLRTVSSTNHPLRGLGLGGLSHDIFTVLWHT